MLIHPDDIITFREGMRLICFHAFAPCEVAPYVAGKLLDCYWTNRVLEDAFKFWRDHHTEQEFHDYLDANRTPILQVSLRQDYPHQTPILIP